MSFNCAQSYAANGVNIQQLPLISTESWRLLNINIQWIDSGLFRQTNVSHLTDFGIFLNIFILTCHIFAAVSAFIIYVVRPSSNVKEIRVIDTFMLLWFVVITDMCSNIKSLSRKMVGRIYLKKKKWQHLVNWNWTILRKDKRLLFSLEVSFH